MDRRLALGLSLPALLLAAAIPGCGGAGYTLEIEVPDLVVTIVPSRLALSPGETATITVRVQNTGDGVAEGPLIQMPGPIGFRYDSVSCLAAGAVFCPPISVPLMAAGILYPSIPPRSELAFTFTGVAVSDVGSQISIAAAARLDADYEQSNNAALLVIPVVAPPAAASR